MVQYVLVIAIIALLWRMCLSTHQCNRTMNATDIIFTCPSIITDQELALYDLTTAQLDSITSITGTGTTATSPGPFTSIPYNICLLRNLQIIKFSNNLIVQVDPTGALTNCLSNVVTLDLSYNNISTFPSSMTYTMSNLKNLYFQHNQLTHVSSIAFFNVSLLVVIDFSYNRLTTFEFWALEVQTRADFSNNQISNITNQDFFTEFTDTTILGRVISLTNNSASISFTDAVYEMYNQCNEVYQYLFRPNGPSSAAFFTRKITDIDFGTTQINCSCDLAFFSGIIIYPSVLLGNPPILRATCLNSTDNLNGTLLVNSNCTDNLTDYKSTVNFSEVYPRLCKIVEGDNGTLTITPNITDPTVNTSSYPHYETRFMNPGACLFTFTTANTMTIKCTNDTSNTLSAIPGDLLNSTYMSNITRVTFPSLISSFPSYLCSLPSNQIDLSSQAFTTLSDATFPCLDSFLTIKLSSNKITSVSITNGNFKYLKSLDLSSNGLTLIPYSILTPTPTSLRYLDLRNNSITYIDLFLYTLKDITINLDNNPINSSNILNPQNITLPSLSGGNNSNQTVNITFPVAVSNSTIIIQDTLALEFGICNNFQILRAYLLNLKATVSKALLLCSCASINLKQIYSNSAYSITNDFPCSIQADMAAFLTLQLVNCSNAVNFTSGLCVNSTAAQASSNTTNPVLQSSGSSTATNASNSGRTGLIIGLVLGIVGFLALVGGLVAAIVISKSKAAEKKPIGRAAVVGNASGNNLQSRLQTRNVRAVKLAPISTPTSKLPAAPVSTVLPPRNTFNKTDSAVPAKGIPLRLDPIRSPSNVSPQYLPNSNASGFRPINNPSAYRRPIPQPPYQEPKPQKPSPNQMLNAGGDTRYQ